MLGVGKGHTGNKVCLTGSGSGVGVADEEVRRREGRGMIFLSGNGAVVGEWRGEGVVLLCVLIFESSIFWHFGNIFGGGGLGRGECSGDRKSVV